MARLFPTLAMVAVLLLVAAHGSGMVGPGSLHERLGLGAVGSTLAVHGLAFVHFRAAARRVDQLAEASGMPGWVRAQAEKNRRKALAYLGWGVGLAAASAWSGWLGGGFGHLVGSAMSLAFQAGAFAGMTVLVIEQGRLLRDLQGWASPALSAGDP